MRGELGERQWCPAWIVPADVVEIFGVEAFGVGHARIYPAFLFP